MNRYATLKQLGDGTYGSVLLGRSLESGELVAIKKMKRKFYSWEECMNLREVKSLKKLNHANVVKLKEVIRENDQLYFVFEYMKENLYQLMKDRSRLFPESAVRNIMYQILQGLAFIHKHGFFHRDMKPENLLCMGPELVKIADFGLAREIRSRPPYTDYVSTRWYRAPEVLLRSTSYSSPIDQWAVGCIMAELYTLRPLFPGSSEVDTIFKICQVLGTPKKVIIFKASKRVFRKGFYYTLLVLGVVFLAFIRYKNESLVPTYKNVFNEHTILFENISTFGTGPLPRAAKPEPRERQPLLPLLHDKVPQQQRLPEATEKAVLPGVHTKPKAGRRRWAHVSGVLKSSGDWDDFEDVEVSSLSRMKVTNDKRRHGDEALSRFGSMLNLDPANGRAIGNPPSVNGSLSCQDPALSRITSAKQHYLKQSRYLPGLSAKKNGAISLNLDCPANGQWGSASFPLGVGGTVPGRRTTQGPSTLPRDYAPSFYKKEVASAGQRVQLAPLVDPPSSNYATWKSGRSQLAPPSYTSPSKSTPGVLPHPPAQPVQPVHGRIDWAAKYGHR
nr:PREDICTED: serine/threonine-protein kinase ICK [Lepisosteus oculatus]